MELDKKHFLMTEAQRKRFHLMCDEMDKQETQANLGSYDNMCSWLRRDHYSFYLQVKDELRELWNEVKTIVGNIAGGVVLGMGGAVLAPVVGVYAGVKEGLENGVEAGVKEGFKTVGRFFNELLK